MEQTASHRSLGQLLAELGSSPSTYLRVARDIEKLAFQELVPVNIGILSTFTADILNPYLTVESAKKGMLAKPFFGPFNQLEQQIFDEHSNLYESDPQVVFIAQRLEELAPRLVRRFVSLTSRDIEMELTAVEDRLRGLIEGLRRRSQATVLLFNYADPQYQAAGLSDPTLQPSQAATVQSANQRLSELCRSFPDVYIFDYARLMCEYGLRTWYDPKLWFLGRIPFGARAQLALATQLARYIRAVVFPSCKCLVVDLDNTLWGGVIGEDGIDGIILGEDYPGNVFKDFQRRLLDLRDQGILLAIASKNNEADVLQAFERREDLDVKLADFAAVQIHWGDKAASLSAIAAELNIGTDALAFFDDSPVERDWIRSKMPEVTVIDVPNTPLGYVHALNESGAFDRLTLSTEDRQRAEMYQRDKQRKSIEANSISKEDFLRQLETVAKIAYINAQSLPRVSQLLSKTNQFNLTTRRHSASELAAMMERGAVGLTVRVRDRFGDNGLVGVAIAVPDEAPRWRIDTFLMSCRIIGREVESALLGKLSRIVTNRGARILIGEYLPSRKNGMAADFYKLHNFVPLDKEGHHWAWDLSGGEIPCPVLVEVVFDNGN